MDKDQELYYKKGDIYLMSSGEYSDYHVLGAWVALQNVTQEQAMEVQNSILRKVEQEEEGTGWYSGNKISDFINHFF